MARDIKEVISEIESWGDNIAKELDSRGIKGRKGNCELCPLANYIFKEINVEEIQVEGYGIWYGPMFELDYIPIPDNMTEFIEDFDDGQYPQLDVEDPEEEVPEEDPDQIPMW